MMFELGQKIMRIKPAPKRAFLLAKALEFLLEIFNVNVLPPCSFTPPTGLIVLGGCTHDGGS
jgi:hypothetical protein